MFDRDVYVTLDKENMEIDGLKYEGIKSFGISIKSFDEVWKLEGFDPNETVYLIEALSEARKSKRKYLRIELDDCGFIRYIDVPRWAYAKLIEQIWRYIGYKHGDSEN